MKRTLVTLATALALLATTVGGTLAATRTGTDAGEVLNGTPGDDLIHLKAGDDTSRARQGHDQVHGERGNDELYGEEGNDLLYGGPGGDLLVLGPGRDKAYGAGGNDRIYSTPDTRPDSLYCGAGNRDLAAITVGDLIDDILVLEPGDVTEVVTSCEIIYLNGVLRVNLTGLPLPVNLGPIPA